MTSLYAPRTAPSPRSASALAWTGTPRRARTLDDEFFEMAEVAFVAARLRGIAFSSDHRGSLVRAAVDRGRRVGAWLGLVLTAMEWIECGRLHVDGEVEAWGADRWLATVTCDLQGRLVHPDIHDSLLLRLQLSAVDGQPRCGGSVLARGCCPSTSAAVELLRIGEGHLRVTWRALLGGRDAGLPGAAPLHASREVWLVDSPDLEGVRGQLVTRGCDVRSVASIQAAARRLRRAPASPGGRLLLVASERQGDELSRLAALTTIGRPLDLLLAVPRGSPSLREAAASAVVSVALHPLRPRHLDALAAPARGAQERAMTSAPIADALVIVVDDDAGRRLATAAVIRALGHRGVACGNGRPALEACRFEAPDLVLIDIDGPRLDGLATAARMRMLQRAGTVGWFAMVAALGSPAPGIGRRCLEAGLDGFLDEPLAAPSVASALRRWLPRAP